MGNKNLGGFEKIYPVEDEQLKEEYDSFNGTNIVRNRKFVGDPNKQKDIGLKDKNNVIEKQELNNKGSEIEKKVNKYYIKNKSIIKNKYGINVALKKIGKNYENPVNKTILSECIE